MVAVSTQVCSRCTTPKLETRTEAQLKLPTMTAKVAELGKDQHCLDQGRPKNGVHLYTSAFTGWRPQEQEYAVGTLTAGRERAASRSREVLSVISRFILAMPTQCTASLR